MAVYPALFCGIQGRGGGDNSYLKPSLKQNRIDNDDDDDDDHDTDGNIEYDDRQNDKFTMTTVMMTICKERRK